MNYGLIENPFDPRDVWDDELLAGDTTVAEEPLPRRYIAPDAGEFEPQGSWPFCVAFSVKGLIQQAVRRASGVVAVFSAPHLFFHGGGGRMGAWFRGVLDLAVSKGVISNGQAPMPLDIWNTETFDGFRRAMLDTPFRDPQKIPGYVRINPNPTDIKRAILKYGSVMVEVAASGGYWKEDKLRPAGYANNHGTRLKGWDDAMGRAGVFIAQDSLQPKAGFNGEHTFSQKYEFGAVYAVRELPADWKKQRDDVRKARYQHALDHYGYPRNLEAEQRASVALIDAFRRLSDKATLDAAGPLWTVYINAVVYGGYSVSYRKMLREFAGDIINDAYSRRTKGVEIFDFNRPRSTYP